MKIILVVWSLLTAGVVLPLKAQSLGYVLQAEHLAEDRADAARTLSKSGRQVLVLDEFFSSGAAWTRDDIAVIRSGQSGRRVLAYLSIGEAENYRPYWQSAWAVHPPVWVLGENPDWPGNFRVKFWDSSWQAHLLEALHRILDAGFDGVYLDLVDAFEGFEHDPATGGWRDHLQNPETGQTYRQDMSDLVQRLAATAREYRPGFWMVPQNGVQLLEDESFRELVDAVGVEDVFTEDNRRLTAEETAERIGYVRLAGKKPVFVIEYARSRAARKWAQESCQRQGLSLLITNRALDQLGDAFPP